jgi:DNA-binding NarL/FixJ family response regulator
MGAHGTDFARETSIDSPARVLVVDDHRAFAEAIGLTIDSQTDGQCVAIARSAKEALAYVSDKCPDIVLLDLGLPDRSGLEVLIEIKRRSPETRVLLISGAVTPDALTSAAGAGADGYVHKEAALGSVIEAVRGASDLMVADKQAPATLNVGAAPLPIAAEFGLTARELQVLALLADGVATKSIAKELGITVNTCRGHVRAILHKLDTHSQLAAVVKAARHGLLPTLRT